MLLFNMAADLCQYDAMTLINNP